LPGRRNRTNITQHHYSVGSTDGEAINLKSGVTGDVGYNVIYSQAGTGIKLETNADVPFPQTTVNVFNNTLVSNGWRRGAAEPGRGVSAGVNAIGHIFNNIMVDNYQGLEIFTDAIRRIPPMATIYLCLR